MPAPFVDPPRTPHEVGRSLAERLEALRSARGWKRTTLARAGVSPASLERFETTGKVSLESFLRLCDALGRLSEVDRLLQPPAARTMVELERQARAAPPRRRGRV